MLRQLSFGFIVILLFGCGGSSGPAPCALAGAACVTSGGRGGVCVRDDGGPVVTSRPPLWCAELCIDTGECHELGRCRDTGECR